MYDRRLHQQAGIALLGAMLLLAIVAATATALAASQHHQYRRTQYVLDARRQHAALTALEALAAERLEADIAVSAHDHLAEDWASVPLTMTHGGLAVRGELHALDGLFNLANLDVRGGRAGAPRRLRPAAVDDAASQDPNAPGPPGSDGMTAANSFRLLLAALDLETDLGQALFDWIDADAEPRYPNGAEDAWYLEQSPPYRSANRVPADIRELRLVRGWHEDAYTRLRPFLVILPERTPININTAPAEILMALGPGIDRGFAELIVSARAARPFRSEDEFEAFMDTSGRPDFEAPISVAVRYFELRTTIAGERFTRRVHTVFERNGGRILRQARYEAGY